MFVKVLLLSVCCVFLQVQAKPNFVFILTDDQDVLLNSMSVMNHTNNLIAAKGITLKNAFVNSPICCPSRSTILTGKHLHNIGVRNNSLDGNCSSIEFQNNYEINSIASLLKEGGEYKTFYAGKYLNQYGNKHAGGLEHVPKGYDWWIGLEGNSKYYNYSLSINGTETFFEDSYLTDKLVDYSLEFLNQEYVTTEPFFMMIAPPASHAPFTPAQRHETAFPETTAVKTPSFNYSTENKHWLMQLPPKHLPTNITNLDEIHKNRLRTLLSVDELVETVITKLDNLRILDNTYVIFSSDNGYHIGQFGQPYDKRQIYETDLRVPFLIRGPNLPSNKQSLTAVSSVDIAPTVLAMATVEIPSDMDGRSFKKDLEVLEFVEDFIMTESNILIEYFGEGNSKTISESCPWFGDENLTQCTTENWCKCQDSRNNTYNCIRTISSTTDFKFCQFTDDTNFVEAYDLNKDPYELDNIFGKLGNTDFDYYKRLLLELTTCKGGKCQEMFNKMK